MKPTPAPWSGEPTPRTDRSRYGWRTLSPPSYPGQEFQRVRKAARSPRSSGHPSPPRRQSLTCSAAWPSARPVRQGPLRLRGQERQVHLLRSASPCSRRAAELATRPGSTPSPSRTPSSPTSGTTFSPSPTSATLVKLLDEEMDGVAQRTAAEPGNRRGGVGRGEAEAGPHLALRGEHRPGHGRRLGAHPATPASPGATGGRRRGSTGRTGGDVGSWWTAPTPSPPSPPT